jgi:hypothetical protein
VQANHTELTTAYLKHKVFYISPVYFKLHLEKGTVWRVSEGIPNDSQSRVVSSGFDSLRGLFYLIVEHPSFKEIRVGDQLPIDQPVITRMFPGETV